MSLLEPVLDALGGSFAYEELKGDFELARQRSEEAVNDQPTEDAILTRAVVHVLQGQPLVALKLLTDLPWAASASSEQLLLGRSLYRLAAQVSVNLFPDGGGGFGRDQPPLLATTKVPAQIETRLKKLKLDAEPSGRSEAARVQFLSSLLAARGSVRHRTEGNDRLSQTVLRAVMRLPETTRKELEASGAPPQQTGFVRACAADICFRAGESVQAAEHLREAAKLYELAGDRIGIGTCLISEADWAVAPNSSPLMLDQVLRQSDQTNKWMSRDAVEVTEDDLIRAGTLYDQADAAFHETGAERGVAAVALRRAYLASLRGDHAGAVALLSGAMERYSRLGDRLAVSLCEAHRFLQGVASGVDTSQPCGAIGLWVRETGCATYGIGLALLMARFGGRLLLDTGDAERALACYRGAAELCEASDLLVTYGSSLVDRGDAFHLIGDGPAAREAYRTAEAMMVRMADDKTISPERRSAAWDTAIQASMNVVHSYMKDGDAAGISTAARRMGEIASRGGGLKRDSTRAVGQLMQGSSLSSAVAGQIMQWGWRLVVKGVGQAASWQVPLYEACQAIEGGQIERASQLFQESLNRARKVVGSGRYQAEATVLLAMRARPAAVTMFRTYLAQQRITHDQLFEDRTLAGGRYKRHGDHGMFETAALFFCAAHEYEEAAHWLRAIINISGDQWWAMGATPFSSLQLAAEIAERLGDLDRAEVLYKDGIAQVERWRGQLRTAEARTRLSGDSPVHRLYLGAARMTAIRSETDLVGAGAHAADSLTYAERGKARALYELVSASRRQKNGARAGDEDFVAWRGATVRATALREQLDRAAMGKRGRRPNIADIQQRLSIAEAEERTAGDRLSVSNPTLFELVGQSLPVVAASEISTQLAPGAALIEYALWDDTLLVWTITADGVRVVRRADVDRRAVTGMITRFRQLCANKMSTARAIDDAGIPLSRLFLDPVADVLSAYERIIIVPHGASHGLPFQVLPWQGDALTGSHTISYLPAASLLPLLPKGVIQANGRVLTVGVTGGATLREDNVYFKGLPWAGVEARCIANLFEGATCLLDQQASASRVLDAMSGSEVVHIASHCYLDDEAPMETSLLMHGAERIEMKTLLGLRLKMRLVTLSACESGVGHVTRGDDVLGLTRALFATGASAIVVSLWEVADTTTCLLMTHFYEELQHRLDVAESMRTAQCRLRAMSPSEYTSHLRSLADSIASAVTPVDPTHPYYWAPFTVGGWS